MATITVLQHGHPIRTSQGIIGFCSTYLIRGEKTTLVDVGHVGRRNSLIAALAAEGVEPGDIETVLLTHAHWDHAQNIDLFPNAELLLHPWERKYAAAPHPNDWATPAWTGAMLETHPKIREVEEGFDVEPGVMAIHTPGHSPGCLTVLVENEGTTDAITGDVLHYGTVALTKVNPLVFWNENDATRSIERILDVADVIYPGHDRPFRVVGDKIEYQAAQQMRVFGLDPGDPGTVFDASERPVWIMPGIEDQTIG